MVIAVLTVFSLQQSFADVYTLTIPSGASSPDCQSSGGCYLPTYVSIHVGDTINWDNHDSAAHTVTSGDNDSGPDGSFDSGLFLDGRTYSHTFDESGEFPYFCQVHPWMTGTIVVDDSSSGSNSYTNSITVYTDSSRYSEGDTINIAGRVGEKISGYPVTLQIVSANGNLVTVESLDVENNNIFETSIDAGGSLWSATGTYVVKVLYGTDAVTAETTFYYTSKSSSSGQPSANSIQVGNLGQRVNYQISGGKVLSADLDYAAQSIIFGMDSTRDGQIKIVLPRSVLDARNGPDGKSGSDVDFFVLTNGFETDFDETTTSTTRTLTVSFDAGTTQIEVIGTAGGYPSNGNYDNEANNAPPPTSSLADVTISYGSSSSGCEKYNSCYSPSTIRIKTGDNINWYNADSAAHTVTSGSISGSGPDGKFDSGLFLGGKTYSHTFDESGTYPYFCQIHPWMTGTVIASGGHSNSSENHTDTSASLSVQTDSSTYGSGQMVTLSTKTGSNSNVAVSVIDPSGNNILTRTVSTDSSGFGQIQFKVSDNARTGSYKVSASASINGVTVNDSASFSVTSSNGNLSIISVMPTDQNGDPVSSFNRGKLGFVKVVVSSDSSISSLITVNLFDSDLTSLGIGSFKTTLNGGDSEIVISFFIPNDAVSGTGDIYVNAFSDWPSKGGVPLSGESSQQVSIR